jgi:hypothetical protein
MRLVSREIYTCGSYHELWEKGTLLLKILWNIVNVIVMVTLISERQLILDRLEFHFCDYTVRCDEPRYLCPVSIDYLSELGE